MGNEVTPGHPPVFHLGLTMAGAASAGCYTAGVMDYLFDMLDTWEKARNGQLPAGWSQDVYRYVSKHKVVIDAMGGTSAGGMTTVMSAIYALKGNVNPVRDPSDKAARKNNVLYDSWVLMGDEENQPKLLEKTFSTDDLKDTGKIQSILNSAFIDSICDDAFRPDGSTGNKLPFIADDLELVLSHTMLRSIPLAIDFNTPIGGKKRFSKNPEHCTFEHFTISHFKLGYDPNRPGEKDRYLPLDPFGPGAAAMKLATKATGAFPLGLRFREFFNDELTAPYLKNITRQLAFNRLSDIPAAEVPDIDWEKDFPDPFRFVSVDGGALNNEPFGEVMAILKDRYGKKKPGEDYKYAMVMIDPFPDVPPGNAYKQPDDLFSVVPAIIGTLWDQAKVKRAEMLDAYSSEYYRGEIFPVRWKKQKQDEPYPIACGAAMAFAGFLDIDFRHHDFFLGRDNARNFFRAYFNLPYYRDDAHPENNVIHEIHRDWTPEMVDMFKVKDKDGNIYLPIIPDLFFANEKLTNTYEGPFKKTVKEWPQFDSAKLFAANKQMKARFLKMLEMSFDKLTGAAPPATESERLVKKAYQGGWWKRFTAWLGNKALRFVFWLVKGKVANRMTKAATGWVLKDLEANGLLKKGS